MFINIIRKSFHLLENALVKRYEQLKHYSDTIQHLPNGLNEKYVDIYFLLIQASLFSENGISTQEIMEVSRLSRTTITNRLKTLSEDNLIIKKTFGNMRCYSLNLDVVDELAALVLDDAE
jgi:DNA-binding MarR family transcriptional regulator